MCILHVRRNIMSVWYCRDWIEYCAHEGVGVGGGGGGWVGISTGIKCEYISFPSGPVQRVFIPSSPVWINEKIQLNCTFKGWPRPTVVWINPHGKKIINGSDGFEMFEKLIGDDTLSSVLMNPHMQEKHDGVYWCTAENSFDGWSSKLSTLTELLYECK